MQTTDRAGLTTIWTSAAAVFILLFTIWRGQPPSPKGLDASPSVFSAARALAIHKTVFPTDEPHPIGSPAARGVERRIIAELQGLGIEHEVQETFVCTTYQICATVRNIVARLPAQTSASPVVHSASTTLHSFTEAVLLASHYDSVAAGPGASDDGASVAALLEIARLIKAEHHKRDVLLLFDEGEEAGLLGAEGFIRKYPGAASVVAVVNGEARGTSGQSFMFESSPGNSHLIDLLASGVSRPVTSSVFYSIYQRLPNDTDFTIFKRYERQGLNFAFLGDVARYHTPLDRRQFLDPGTMQHHGDNLVGATRALADGNLAKTYRNATFFDIGGFVVVRWPEAVNRYLGVAVLLIALIQIRRRRLRQNWWCLLIQPAAILAAAVLSAAFVQLLVTGGALPTPFVAHPLGLLCGSWLLGLVVAEAAHRLGSREDRDTGGITAILFASLSLLLSWFLPGAAYLFLVPAFFLLLPLLVSRESRAAMISEILPFAVAGLLVFPLLWRLYGTLGNPALIVITVAITVVALLLPPSIIASRRVIAAGALASALLFAASFFLPAYSADSPRRLNVISNRDEPSRECRWLLEKSGGSLPRPLASVRQWSPYQYVTSGGQRWDAMAALHPCGDDSGPRVEQIDGSTEGATRILRYRLYSPRQAPTLTWTFESGEGVAEIVANGEVVPLPSPGALRAVRPGWRQIQFRAVPPLGVVVELHLRGPQPVRGVLSDSAMLSDPGSAPILAARNASGAVRFGEGDVSVIRKQIAMGP
ncbi:MAG TPA: M20/M25/M40 family metallo-hydrolase [Thermoanaerobaculia bacterium]|nr:M20/M25/M40 family metallo-hydrolase [Thermoanaerobaculia bacterium]